MMIHSDWHIHSEASYDASLSLQDIVHSTAAAGLRRIGITDHVNFNDSRFLCDLHTSVEAVTKLQKICPHVILGVELTPIEKPEFDYIAKIGSREGYIPPRLPQPYEIELARTKAELTELGVRYAIGAAHWRVDIPYARTLEPDMQACIREWLRQQLWLACDERVTVLGHPWYHGRGLWYEDFSVIPRSMNNELIAALKENRKYTECNAQMLCDPQATEKFRHQYAEFLRELFEQGIPITYGSDAHDVYGEDHIQTEKYLLAAGFQDGDIVEIAEEDLW